MRKMIAVAMAALLAAAAFAADVSLTDEEKERCAAEGGCVFTSVQFVRQRLEAAFVAGFEKGKAMCGSKGST